MPEPSRTEHQPSSQEWTNQALGQLSEIQEAHERMDPGTAIDLTITKASRIVLRSLRQGDALPIAVGTRMIESAYYQGQNIGKLKPESHIQAKGIISDGKSWLMGYRESLLDELVRDPNNNEVWDDTFALVDAEADTPARWTAGDRKPRVAIADEIPGTELVELAQRVRAASPEDRYELMTHEASNGEQWFDVLKTFSSPQIEAAETVVIDTVIHNQRNGAKFHSGLDLGTGTGKSLAKLEERADRVTGLDENEHLLRVAQGKAESNTNLVLGSVDQLPFEAASFDVITSTGLTGALDRDMSRSFYSEIARMLTEDGVYIDGTYTQGRYGMGEEMKRITATARATLSDMIVDTVSGKLELRDHLYPDEKAELLESLGLNEEERSIPSENGYAQSLIRIITKK